jgi:hypothetical protein
MEESMAAIDRRKLMAGAAIGTAAVTLAAVPALAGGVLESATGGGELARLVRRYFAEVAAFNADPRVDDDHFFLADQAFDATLKQMVGVGAQRMLWLASSGS